METIKIRFLDYNDLSIKTAYVRAYGLREAIEKLRVSTDYTILILEIKFYNEQALLEDIIPNIMEQYL